jgi:hypothetical protein
MSLNKMQLGLSEDVTDARHKITLYNVAKCISKFLPQLENKKNLTLRLLDNTNWEN